MRKTCSNHWYRKFRKTPRAWPAGGVRVRCPCRYGVTGGGCSVTQSHPWCDPCYTLRTSSAAGSWTQTNGSGGSPGLTPKVPADVESRLWGNPWTHSRCIWESCTVSSCEYTWQTDDLCCWIDPLLCELMKTYASCLGESLVLSFKCESSASAKIGHVHIHPVVMCVTLPNMGPIALNSHFTRATHFAENLISLA